MHELNIIAEEETTEIDDLGVCKCRPQGLDAAEGGV